MNLSEAGLRPSTDGDIPPGDVLRFLARCAVALVLVAAALAGGYAAGPVLGRHVARLDLERADRDFVRPTPPDLADLPARSPSP
ncbi:hypothetical protein ACFQY4_06010 [Catellatospora bangladeshensis]|uniref:Uncharacterized protein n=1 Tax=Catellatospora bangladeshensis TaxID=310355 RepID=A0A8J3JHL9_9ACTN|nr:hypothetical protein [Catellatospora bangladeshensis]GIF85022.1 hypothetical protein Cba03nite_63710 [Catellatospora bangladeshensis]